MRTIWWWVRKHIVWWWVRMCTAWWWVRIRTAWCWVWIRIVWWWGCSSGAWHSSTTVNATIICLFSPKLHQSYFFSSSSKISLPTWFFSYWGSYRLCSLVPSSMLKYTIFWLLSSNFLICGLVVVTYVVQSKSLTCSKWGFLPQHNSWGVRVSNTFVGKWFRRQITCRIASPQKLLGLAYFWVSFMRYSLRCNFFTQPYHLVFF